MYKKTIAFITDTHLDEQYPIDLGIDARVNWKRILSNVSARQIDHIIFGGDIGEKEANNWFFDSLSSFNLDLLLGNHDHFDEVIRHHNGKLQDGFEEFFYSYEEEFFKSIFLDSSSGSVSENQFNWLSQEISTSKPILIFIHHPVLAVNTHIDKRYPLFGREKIEQLLAGSNQKVTIFCGHYHTDDECTSDHITQIITPAASYQALKNPDKIEIEATKFGYRLIHLDKNTITTELVMFSN